MQPIEVKDKITGVFEPTGEEVSFNTRWGDHEFTDHEVTKLLAGQEIDVQGTGKKGTYTYRGKLSSFKYKGKASLWLYWKIHLGDLNYEQYSNEEISQATRKES